MLASGTVSTTRQGRYLVMEAALPGFSGPIGVLLQDPQTDRLYTRFRRDLENLDEVLAAVPASLEARAAETGAGTLLDWCGDALSNAIRATDIRQTLVDDFERTAERLYQRYVRPAFDRSTHVPLLSLRSAAGQFLENAEIETADWIEVPESVRINDRYFAASIQGTSMEPAIPDGSVCLFRRFEGGGSRSGMLVLVEEAGSRYTVKRYTSRKAPAGDGNWKHEAIVLEPLNPEHEDIVLLQDEERYRVIAEFIRVLF